MEGGCFVPDELDETFAVNVRGGCAPLERAGKMSSVACYGPGVASL